MLTKKVTTIVFLLWTLFLTGCLEESYEKKNSNRAKLAGQNKQEIVIGVAWTEKNHSFLQGVKLAVKKINSEGGVIQRQIKVIINKDETALLKPGLSTKTIQTITADVANSFAENSEVIAVVGHYDSNAALLASIIYQNNGILFLASNATNTKITNHQFDYIFRTIPNNEEMGTQIADYVAEQGYQNIALLYDRGIYATELSDTFSAHITEDYGANIVFRRSFFENTLDKTALIIDLKKVPKLDMIFIASNSQLSADLYQKSRNMGIRVPFSGGETLDSPLFLTILEEWEISEQLKKTSIPTIFNHFLPKNQEFIALFKQTYGKDAQVDHYTVSGYDNIMLLAHAIQRAQSSIPLRIADSLRYMPPCLGLAGKYQFTETGELASKPFYFKHFEKEGYKFKQLKSQHISSTNQIETCNDIDRDEDSIPNDLDACPDNTPKEISKGIILTGLLRGCPIDSDGDGVPDYRDDCPNNTAEEISKGVNKRGCPIDSDADNSPDYIDQCPNNPKLNKFGNGKNCIEDKDADGIADKQDKCPDNTPKEIALGVNKQGNQIGCPIDSDQDNIADYQDNCPKNTLAEIAEGVNFQGCPVDNDTDNLADYQDNCLNNTEFEMRYGVDNTGCPIDTDNDKIADYMDDCPNSQLEISLGVDNQGCANDLDEDGIYDYKDKCLTTPPKILVDTQGCALTESNITLSPIALYFQQGQLILTDKGKKLLATFIKTIPNKLLKQLTVIVHTDNQGSSKGNQLFSEKRAKDITQYFQQQGITAKTISFQGKGESMPIAENKTETGRKKNQRLELIITQFIAKDKDGDRINDDIDTCLYNTPEELTQGVYIIGERIGCPIDSDDDGVADYHDECQTNSKVEISQGVNAQGCPRDYDEDGLLDYQDKCLQTPINVWVDEYGCGITESRRIQQPLVMYFKPNQTTLSEEGKAYLESLLGQINQLWLQQLHVIIYVTQQKESLDNTKLIEQQLKTLIDYLQLRGIADDKITSQIKIGAMRFSSTQHDTLLQTQYLEFTFLQFKNKPLPNKTVTSQ